MVNIFYEDIENLDLDSVFLERWLSKVCVSEGKPLGELTLIFCSDDYLLDINVRHLNHDYFTDIITFDYTDEDVSGDLFISVERVRENAESHKTEFVNELYRVIVHGVLHLLGYNDKSEEEVALMRKREDVALDLIVPRET